jgi:hypothetical protein
MHRLGHLGDVAPKRKHCCINAAHADWWEKQCFAEPSRAKGRLSDRHVEVTLENATPTPSKGSLRLMRTTRPVRAGTSWGRSLGRVERRCWGELGHAIHEMKRWSGARCEIERGLGWYFCTLVVLFVAVIFCPPKVFLELLKNGCTTSSSRRIYDTITPCRNKL